MKKPLILALTLFTVVVPVVYQNAQAEQPEVRRAEAVKHTERKPGFFQRLFKRSRGEQQKEPGAVSTPPTRKAIATDASEIKETPKPGRRKSTPPPASTPTLTPSEDQAQSTNMGSAPSPSPEPDATPEVVYPDAKVEKLAGIAAPPKSTPAPASEVESKPESTPQIQVEPEASQLKEPIPFVAAPESEESHPTPVPDLLDPEYVKKVNERYKQVRSEALEDGKVSTLRDDADGAFEPAERAKALRVYYEALFHKMREIDPSLASRIDGREKATMRRIESLTPVGE